MIKKELLVDLHMHTTHSDGELTPTELVKEAKKAELDIIAVTDHDTTEGIDEAKEAGEKLSVRIIPGIEISSHTENFETHMLGLGMNYEIKDFQDGLTNLRGARIQRIEKICNQLKKLGLKVEPEEVLGEAEGLSVGRPHVARVLLKKGYVNSVNQAFRRYLKYGAVAYVESQDFSPKQAINLIKCAGGVPVLSHPGLIGDDTIIPQIVGDGLMGLEVFHRYDKQSRCDEYLKIAKRYKLFITGGSDFHTLGDSKETAAQLGDITCPYEYFVEIEKNFSKV